MKLGAQFVEKSENTIISRIQLHFNRYIRTSLLFEMTQCLKVKIIDYFQQYNTSV